MCSANAIRAKMTKKKKSERLGDAEGGVGRRKYAAELGGFACIYLGARNAWAPPSLVVSYARKASSTFRDCEIDSSYGAGVGEVWFRYLVGHRRRVAIKRQPTSI